MLPLGFLLSILLIFLQQKDSRQQSAELEDLQKLCPGLRGIYCTHCSHKSVEDICPMQCQFCGVSASGLLQGGGGGGFPQQKAGFGASSRVGNLGGMLMPQHLGTLKRQCTMIRGLSCFICKVPSISELCVDQCLACENGPLVGPGIGTGDDGVVQGGDLLDGEDGLDGIGGSLTAGTGTGEGDKLSSNLFEIFEQLQRMELAEKEQLQSAGGGGKRQRNQQMVVDDEDVGAENGEADEEDMGQLQ